MLQSSMATINECAAENEEPGNSQHQYKNNREGAIGNENDSADEASYSSATSLDSLADSRARSQKARNITEKRRRDKLNMYINQLAALLPSADHHRMDKSSVLKQGVDYLKRYNSSSEGTGNGGLKDSSFLSAEELGELTMEALDGVVLIINECGVMKYVAEQVNTVFGFESANLVGQSIEKLVHPNDLGDVISKVKRQSPEEKAPEVKLTNIQDYPNSVEQQPGQAGTQFVECSFRIAPGDADSDNVKEVHCKGFWKDRKYTENDLELTESLLVLLAMPKAHSSLRELSYPKPLTFSSRHGMDGKFLFVDTSCTRVTGYLPYELLNTSLYFYVHEADLDELINAHTSLTTVVDIGSILVFFQFRSKSDQWLLMKVILRVTYNPMTSKPEYFNANLSPATHNEILQYKKLKLSNSTDKENKAGSWTPSDSSAMLFSIVRANQKQRKLRKSVHARKQPKSSVSTSSETCTKEPESLHPVGPATPSEMFVSNFSNEMQLNVTINQKAMSEVDGKDSEAQLHLQLNEKIEALSQSIKRQKMQLEKINSMMMELRPKMFSSDGLIRQQEQEQQIFEYISSTLAEQQKQCIKLKATLEGKIRISEAKRRAMELRGKVRSSLVASSALGQPGSAGNMSPYQTADLQQRPALSVEDGFRTQSSVEMSPQSYPGTQPAPADTSTDNAFHEEAVLHSQRSGSYESFAGQDQQSLQIQLQQLQHQQDFLNAQGMALAAQGTISRSQLEFVQTLMHQQKSLLPGTPLMSPSNVQSDVAGRSRQGSSFETLKEQHNSHQMLNSARLEDHPGNDAEANIINQPSVLALNKLLQKHVASKNTDSSLQYQILSQLQNLQHELQLQMQVLRQQEPQGGATQSGEVAKVITALQQLQQMQIRLLQDAIPDKNAVSQGSDRYVPSPSHSAQQSLASQFRHAQQKDATSGPNFPSMYSMDSNGKLMPGQGHVGESQMFRSASTSGQGSPKVPNPNMPSPNVPRDSKQFTAAPPRPAFPNYPSYSGFSSTDGLGSFSRPSLTDPRQNDGVRTMHLGKPDPSESKGKKLVDSDNFYQYIDSLPGQTQQLLQLHQAQRMHIVRCQHQQLQALQQRQGQPDSQPQQQEPHQQPSVQHQQQQQLCEEHPSQHHLQPNHQSQHKNMKQVFHGEASTSSQVDASHVNYGRQPGLSIGNEPDPTGTPSLGQWETDLQADQVTSMSDLDLFELLSGQAAMSLTEADEQVLDILIAEGGDMFPL